MFNIEMAGYAALPGFLALVIAFFIAPGIRRYFHFYTDIFPRHLVVPSLLIVIGLFVLLLLFIEPGFSAVAFLAGIISTFLFLTYSFAVFKSAGACSWEGRLRSAGLGLGLAAPGVVLTAVGIFFSFFAWKNVSILNVYALGAACTLFVASLGGIIGRDGDGNWRFVAHSTDFYISSLCVLVAAIAMGAAMTEFQWVWIVMPVLFTMAGLAASMVGVVVMRAVIHGRPWFFRFLVFLSTFAGMIVQYLFLKEMTRKMSAGTIAGLGMLDRMGALWASMTGVVTGVLLIILFSYAATPAGRGHKDMTFGFSLYFMAVGLWMSHLFADLYGIAFAGIGMLGVMSLPAGRQLVRLAEDHRERGDGFMFGASALSTLAVMAAFWMWVMEAADIENGLAEIFVLTGLILGVAMFYVMRVLLRRFSEQSLKDAGNRSFFRGLFLSGMVVLFIPLLIGFIVGPETLGGLLLGMVVPGIYEIFRMEKQGDSEEARELNGLMRLVALVSLVAAPLLSGF